MNSITIFSPSGASLLSVPVTAKATHQQELMKTDQVHLEWSAAECVRLDLGCYVVVNSITYTLAKPYAPDSKALGKYDYSVDFEHEVQLLSRVPFLLHSETGTECDWNFTGLFGDLKNTLKAAINKALGYTGNNSYDIDIENGLNAAISLSFSNVDLFSALNSIANALGCEWWTDNAVGGSAKVIHFGVKCIHEGGQASTLQLTAGQEVGYPSSNNKGEFFNRFYIFGSTRNIPQDYQGANANTIVNKRLTLDPTIHPDGYMDLPKYDINGNITETTSTNPNGRPYRKADGTVGYYVVDDSVAQGIRTFTQVLQLDDIYPRAGLKVGHVAKRVRYVRDNNDDKVELSAGVYSTYSVFYVQFVDETGAVFSINATTYQPTTNPTGNVLPNTTPGIHFNSGALTGREFDMYRYYGEAPTLKNETDGSAVDFSAFSSGGIFEITFKEDNTIIIPNDGIEPVVNDEAVVFNIRMPESYVQKGYRDLDQEALVQMYETTKDGNEYAVEGNDVYFAEHNDNIALGRHVIFKTQGRNIDTRVIKITRNLDRNYDLELTFGKAIKKGAIQSILTSIESTQQQVVTTQLESTQSLKEQQKRAYDAQRELQSMIFDSDGYFKDGNIRPTTIETLMLQVGAKSTNFILSGWVLTPNLNGQTQDANYVSWTSGKLTHYGLGEDIREWTISSDSVDLTSSAAHYIYAKCVSGEGATAATIVLTTEQIQYDEKVSTEGAYYFVIGTLSSVTAGIRVANLTYGMSAINGQFITTGVIKSNDGSFYINLNTGELFSANGFNFSSGGQTKSFTEYVTETSEAIEEAADAVNNLQIGGRNLFLYSAKIPASFGAVDKNYWYAPNGLVQVDTDGIGYFFSYGGVFMFYPYKKALATEIKPNTDYVFSVDIKSGSTRGSVTCQLSLFGNKIETKGTQEWQRITVKGKSYDSIVTRYNYYGDLDIHAYKESDDGTNSLYFKRWKLEEGTVATDWSVAPEDVNNSVADLNSSLQKQLTDLEAQIDNEIEYWFGDGVPTTSNAPANEWTTADLKKAHVGDVYMDNNTSFTYKWIVESGSYSWKFIKNDPTATAVAMASQAMAEVGDKSAVMYGGSSPKIPYQKGDMWLVGNDNDEAGMLLMCISAYDSAIGYRRADWDDATKYVAAKAAAAQTTANNAATAAANAASLATAAQSSASTTAAALSKVDNDGYFSTIEKRAMQPQWRAISGRSDTSSDAVAGGSCYDTKAAALAAGIASTDSKVVTLNTRYGELRSYLNAVGLYDNTSYKFTTSYTRAMLSDRFTTYHAAEIALSEAIAKKEATNAEGRANTYADGKAGEAMSAATTAQNMANSYAYLKTAMAEAKAGTKAEGYEVDIQGGVVISNALECVDAGRNVTAGVSGIIDNEGRSIAFWAGAARTNGTLPFAVHHDGSVEMSKATITSGNASGSQVQITTLDGGNVGAIMVGSTTGENTEIIGKASEGVGGMLSKAGISTSSATQINDVVETISASINAVGDAVSMSAGASSLTGNTSKSAYNSVTVPILSGAAGSGSFTFGTVDSSSYSRGDGSVNYSPSNSSTYIGHEITSTISLTLYKNSTAVVIGTISYNNNGVKTANISNLNGKVVSFAKGDSISLRISMTAAEAFYRKSSPSSYVSAQIKAIITNSAKLTISGCSYIMTALNNVLYNDGYFMSKTTDSYLAMSPTDKARIMQMQAGQYGIALGSAGFGNLLRTSTAIDTASLCPNMGVLFQGVLTPGTVGSSSVSIEIVRGVLGTSSSSKYKCSATRSTNRDTEYYAITFNFGVTLPQVPIVSATLKYTGTGGTHYKWRARVMDVTTSSCKLIIACNDGCNYSAPILLTILTN